MKLQSFGDQDLLRQLIINPPCIVNTFGLKMNICISMTKKKKKKNELKKANAKLRHVSTSFRNRLHTLSAMLDFRRRSRIITILRASLGGGIHLTTLKISVLIWAAVKRKLSSKFSKS